MNVLIAALCLTAGAAADQFTEDERRYLTAIIEARDQQLDGIRQNIATLESKRPDPNQVPKRGGRAPKARRSTVEEPISSEFVPKTPKPGTKAYREMLAAQATQINAKIAPLRLELAALESGVTVPGLGGVSLLEQGSIGSLPIPARIVQVAGPLDALVRITGLYRESHLFWMHGFSTKGLADDQWLPFTLQDIVAVDGTKSYTTVLGAKSTVIVLRSLVIDREKVVAEYRARTKAMAPQKLQSEPEPAAKPIAVRTSDPDTAARKRFAGLLANSRSLIKAGLQSVAERNLKRIIAEVPGTAIAAEAEKELEHLTIAH